MHQFDNSSYPFLLTNDFNDYFRDNEWDITPDCYVRRPEGWINMTKEEFNAIQREQQWPEFARLAKDLRAITLDFDYVKTRKALDPRWNEYDMPKDHDVAKEDADLFTEANLVTSRVRGLEGIHRPVLDLDWGAKVIGGGCTRGHNLGLNMRHPIWYALDQKLKMALIDTGIASSSYPPNIVRYTDGMGRVDFKTDCDFSLTDSSTINHKHLIIGKDLVWGKYIELLNTLAQCGIIEAGFAKASIRKGYSAIRPPWVHK